MSDNGYMGKGLRINLSNKSFVVEDFSEEDQRKFMGGQLLGSKILFEELDSNVDPLSENNKLIFATGPLTGTLTPLSRGHMILSKSPLSNAITKSSSGGMFGPELKHTGFDYVVIEGRAEEAVYLLVSDDEVKFREADDLWGKSVIETEDLIKSREDSDIRHASSREVKVACIGPAGENLVKFASIMNEKHNAAARGGLGAVMGSKNLKALAVRGTKDIKVSDIDKLREFRFDIIEEMQGTEFGRSFSKFGTTETVPAVNDFGIFPTKNFQEGQSDEYDENFNPSEISEDFTVREKGCYGCPIHCNKVVDVDTSEGELFTDRQEYETFFSLGSNCDNSSIKDNILAGHICNDLGMDTMSAGTTISLALELAQRDIIDKKRDGMTLEWGDSELILELLRKIGYRDGFGDILAEGSMRAAKILGKDAEKYSMQVKGMEIPGYDPRGAKGMGLTYAVSSRGACHNFAYTIRDEMWTGEADRFTENGKADLVKELSDIDALANSGIICKFPLDQAIFEWEEIKEVLYYVTGYKYSKEELQEIGERSINIERLFNYREGFTREDDTLPDRFLEETLEGPSSDQTVNLEKMLTEYYKIRGWNSDGTPKESKLKELNIGQLPHLIKD